MKKYLSILMLLLVGTISVSLSSCSNDEDEPKDDNVSIVGEWEYVSHEWSPALNSETQYLDYMIDFCPMTFTSSGIYYSEDDLLNGQKYKVNGDKLTIGNEWTVKFSMPDKNTLILYYEIDLVGKYTCAVKRTRKE